MSVPSRLLYVDNLRVCLTMLVVAHHVALVYGNLRVWPNAQPPPTVGEGLPLDAFVLLNQTFFMGLFFLLSGLVAPGSLDRRGPRGFAADRLRRLGIPFLIFLVLLRPIYTLPTYLDLPVGERPSYGVFYLTESDIGPMWFVEVLLIFSLCYAFLRRPGRAGPVAGRLRAWHILGFALVLGAVTYLWRVLVPLGTYVPVLGLPSAAYLPQYVALFAVGVVAHRRGLLSELRRPVPLGLGLVAASLVPMVALGGYETLAPEGAPPALAPAHLGFALWDSLFATGTILLLLGLFRRYANVAGPRARFLARNAYAVYLVHAPIIVGVVAMARPVEFAAVPKFLVVLPIAMALSWLVAGLVTRLPWFRTVL
ncbi:acyltransferase [Nonomuraea sp. MG754425]|uniref:acyltransferase family protein n=1 Tax=Nonomuraea sp. MG754425 TaxID=2570319 RepID=UPI001F2D098E|nr:acyltransferase [Nonomuraea sp. MG754425]MCF6474140.1 acyltransferase [Nonomuraea sp. MG754425]